MRGTLIKMKNKNNLKMVKKFLIVALLIFSLTTASAFCLTQGYVLDEKNGFVNTTRINVVCRMAEGEMLYPQPYGTAYGFPFGDWYDDCSYCARGVYINAVNDEFNLYGEALNITCQKSGVCHTNIHLQYTADELSTKEYYNEIPDVGSLAPEKTEMPKSNESPQTKVQGIKPDTADYTLYYVIGGIILAIIA